jgi:hypothetical protein
MTAAGLSLRAAARRVGCTHKAIRDAVRVGRIAQAPDGSVAPAAVDAWHAGRRAKRGGATRVSGRAAVSNREPAPPTPAGAEAVATAAIAPTTPPPGGMPIDPAALAGMLTSMGMFANRASAELARDSYVARIRQLEYEERAGKLLDADMVRTAIAKATSTVRTRLLAIPSERAVAIHRCKSPAEVQDLLRDAITRALESLSDGFAAEVSP